MSNTLPKRIMDKIQITSSCWNWMGNRNGNYGNVHYLGKEWRAHRAVYTILVGEIPAGLVIDHLCRNTYCVKPSHLEAVTQHENILRGTSPYATYSKRTHCNKGHEFSKENTSIRSESGARRCRICLKDYQRAYQIKNRDKVRSYNRTYYSKHPEIAKNYSLKNHDKLLAYWKEYNKNRRQKAYAI